MDLPSLTLIALGAAAALPVAASAQRASPGPARIWEENPGVTVAFAAGGLYSNLARSAAGHDGFGFDAATYVGVSAFALGVGYQRTVHPNGPTASGVYEGLFVEPRVAVPLGVAFTPYLAGRLVRIQPLLTGREENGRPRGVQLGGGAGVLVALAPRVRLDLGASYSRLRLDDPSRALRPDEASTTVAQARVGLVVGLGRWTR
jgi:hypothetical protein